jgi:uroporphyrinogen-III synthase
VTRAPDRARAWTAALEARGATVAAREVFVLDSMAAEAAARSAVESIESYDWILVTSANGLRFLREALAQRELDVADLRASFGVVGPQTATALAACGVEPRVVAASADSGGLADGLAGRVAPGSRVLVVRPEVSRPELARRLADAGALVDAPPFYRNRPAPAVAAVARELAAGAFDAAVFSSPSSFGHLLDVAVGGTPAIAAATLLIAIGETTAAAIRERGYAVAAVARQPTPEGIAAAVEQARGR